MHKENSDTTKTPDKFLVENSLLTQKAKPQKEKKTPKVLSPTPKKTKKKVHFSNLIEKGKKTVKKKISESNKKISLSIAKEIKIEISSLYENIHKLSNYKYSKDKNLQNKVKKIFKKENQSQVYSSLSSTKLNINLLQSTTKIHNQSSLKSRKTITSTIPNKRNSSFIVSHSLNNSALINKKKINDIKKRRSVFIKKDKIKDMLQSDLNQSPSFNNNESSKISQTKIKNNVSLSNNKLKLGIQRKSTHGVDLGVKSSFNLNGETNKNNLIKNEQHIHRKRRASIINTINSNIKKTNQNLNNPDEFYSNYFNSLLKGEIVGIQNKKNDNFYQKSKTKKEKEKEKEKNQKNRK